MSRENELFKLRKTTYFGQLANRYEKGQTKTDRGKQAVEILKQCEALLLEMFAAGRQGDDIWCREFNGYFYVYQKRNGVIIKTKKIRTWIW